MPLSLTLPLLLSERVPAGASPRAVFPPVASR